MRDLTDSRDKRYEHDRLHPESLRQLKQLVKLHGANPLIRAIQDILAEEAAERRRYLAEVERQENEMKRAKPYYIEAK